MMVCVIGSLRRARRGARPDAPPPARAGRGPSRRMPRLVAVDVDFAQHRAAVHDRHDDLRPGLEAAGEISRIRVHVVDDDRRLLGGGGAADAAAERNPSVRRRLADKRPEHQFVALEQVDAHPVVGRHLAGEHRDRCRHRGVGIGGGGDGVADADGQGRIDRVGSSRVPRFPVDQHHATGGGKQQQHRREAVQPSEGDPACVAGREAGHGLADLAAHDRDAPIDPEA